MKRIILRLVLQGVRDLALNPWAQFSTLCGVVLMVFLSGLFLMALTTLDAQMGMVRGQTSFQVYWKPGVDMEEVSRQWASYPSLKDFVALQSFTPEQALSELETRLSKDGSLKKRFPFLADKSPLPATAFLSFAPQTHDLDEFVQSTTEHLKSLPGVARVVTTPLRDELGRAWRTMSRYIMWPSVAFLAVVMGLVVGNTVRLSLVARAHEVEILQMIGAYNWYIRLPLVVTGSLLGLVGGLLALGLLKLVHWQIHDALNFPPLLMEIYYPSAGMTFCLMLIPAFMGGLASWIAVRSQ
ncbi:permease [Desulfovibrio sp. OttesenSCG-928-G15]|nr:permease [Desulfovibrio sp. OttesenSCG-928-G15]